MNESAVPAAVTRTASSAQVGRVLCASETIYPAVLRRVEFVPPPAPEKVSPRAACARPGGLKGSALIENPGRRSRDGG